MKRMDWWLWALGGAWLFLVPAGAPATPQDPYAEVNASWERFGAVYARIVENYYADLDQREIMRAAIDGMLGELDSYSQFYNEEGVRQLRQDTSGKFAGLGITVAIKDRFPMVISPIEGTPAERAGLQPGDLIVAIEGRSTLGMRLEEVVNTLRGDPGSQVQIEVAHRVGGPARKVSIAREVIKIKSVSLVEQIREGIGYISMRQTRFSEETSSEVERAVRALEEEGVRGLVLDLRGNPGGLLSQATQVADLFLPKGVPIVSIKERDGRREEVKHSQRRPVAEKLPLVVLIDEGSASASEIVAGAIQDNDRGVIVGTPSFGKGSVQTIFDLHEVEDSALKLTTALYYTPSGRSIHREFGGGLGLLTPVAFGEVELPAGQVLDIVLGAHSQQEAAAALRARFDLEEDSARQILATTLAEMIGGLLVEDLQQTADSLAAGERTFYTQRGRKVYGGGGIRPDIVVEADRPPPYVRELNRRRLFFDFVVDYLAEDSTRVQHYAALEPDEEMLDAFRLFVREADVQAGVGRVGHREVQALREMSEQMGWTGETGQALAELEAILQRERERGFSARLDPYIRQALHRELALRLQGRLAQLLISLEGDPQLEAAVKVLEDARRYAQVLGRGPS